MTRSIACAILAAGESRRMGRPKQLLPWRGATLVRHVACEALASRASSVAVVVGCRAAEVSLALAGLDLAILPNDRFAEGVATSVREAARWASGVGAGGLLLAVCDQPYLSSAHLDRLIAAFQQGRSPVASHYGGVAGVPAVFGRESFGALLALQGSRGASALLRRSGVATVEWAQGDVDLDTEDDVARLGSVAGYSAG